MTPAQLGDRWQRHGPWLAATFGSLAVVGILYRIWSLPFGIPWQYSGDMLPNAMLFKAVVDNDTIANNQQLAAPFTQHFQDWPLTDLLPIYLGRLLSIFSSDWPVLLNAVYLLTFPMVGAAAWWVFRKFTVRPWAASVLAIVYAIAPYHLRRSEVHYFLSGYYGVPLGAWLAMSILRGEALFPRGVHKLPLLSWASARTVLFCLIIAASSVYYAAFTVLLVVVAGGARVLRGKWSSMLPAAAVSVLTLGTVALLGLPTLLYRHDYGVNVLAANRSPVDTESFALKLTQLLLPIDQHRIQALADIRDHYVKTFNLPTEAAYTGLGFIAAAGLILLFAYGLMTLAHGKSQPRWDYLRQLSFFAFTAFLVATLGGFSTLIALFLSPQIRAWNRMSIMLAFFALAGLGVAWSRLWGKRPAVLPPVVGIALIAFAMFDQYSPAAAAMASPSTRAAYFADVAFFDDVQRKLPANAMVYQLPAVPYPETPQDYYGGMGLYDQLRPYLLTDNVRWSFGGIVGRVEYEWQRRLDTDPSKLLSQLAAVGYDAIYIDTAAYDDHASAVIATLTQRSGAPILRSADGRMMLFDIRAYRNQLGVNATERNRLLFPVIDQISDRAYPRKADNEGVYQWAPKDVTLPIVNTDARAQPTRATFTLDAPANTAFDITWPDGAQQRVGPGPVQHEWLAVPGATNLLITSNAPLQGFVDGVKEQHFKIRNLTISPR